MRSFKPIILVIITLSITLTISSCNSTAKKTLPYKKQLPKPPVVSQSNTLSLKEIDFKRKITLKSIIIKSKLLNKVMKANIYLPPGYKKNIKYPVLYLLPGSSGDQNFCMPGLKIENYANSMILKKILHPLIIVSPEMDNSFGLNSSNEPKQITVAKKVLYFGRYQDYLTSELIHYMDTHYSTIQNKSGRYIGGISDGGYVALRTAFLHPNQFSKAGGHSPNLDHENPNPKIEALYFPEKQTDNNKNIFYIAKNYRLNGLKTYIDCGNKDTHQFYKGCALLTDILKAKGVNVEYHLNPGTHGSTYWKTQIASYLVFYAGNQ